MSAKMSGLEAWRTALLQRTPAVMKAEIKAANLKSANDHAKRVRRIIPRGDDEGGHLADTIVVESVGELGARVSIGDAAHPYPVHLEAGHRTPDGTHVAGKAYWWPVARLVKKTHKGRMARAMRKGAKAFAEGGST